MSDHPHLELAPLAALGSLDGESLHEWSEHAKDCRECRRELAAFEALAGTMGLASGAQRVSPQVRRRVMAVTAAAATPAPARPRSARAPWMLATAASLAAVAAGVVAVTTRGEKAALERQLAGQSSLTALIAAPGTRVTTLAGLPAAPGAEARMVWNPGQRKAVLLASGLPAAPAGKTYELWVIAGGAPLPAGLFQGGANGNTVFPVAWVEDAAQAKTFAVTLEPAGGVTAPTGPMVLAGAVS